VEEFDPAFRELVQTTNSTASQDVENDADSLDGGESGAEDAGAALLDNAVGVDDTEETDTTDVWITSVYEERIELDSLPSKRVVAIASVDVRAHKVQCVTFSARGDGDAMEQDFSSYLDLLKVMYP